VQPNTTLFFPCRYAKKHGNQKYLPELVSDLKLNVKVETARRYLHRAGLKGRRPVKKPMMTPQHRLKRVHWARAWGSYDFSDIVFSDEKKWVCVQKGQQYVWRPVGMRYHPRYMVPTKQAGGGSCMVWGAISKTKTFPLVRIQTTLNGAGYADLLKQFFKTQGWKFSGSRASRPRVPWTFQHDNASIHRANVVETALSRWKVPVLPWPALSPDLSPIENLWSYVSGRLRGRVFPNPDVLWEAVQQEWAAVPPALLASLYDSMANRCRDVIKGRGYPTRY
jgi:hypothetical protein